MLFKHKNSETFLLADAYDGKYIKGVMDKGVLGGRSRGLLQRVCNDFGNMASSKFIDDLQNIVTEYMKLSAYSVGISDLIADDETNKKIIQAVNSKKKDVHNLIDQLHLNVFENSTGKSNEVEFETKVNGFLNAAAKDAGKIRLEGKEYEVKDGDIMNFRFNN